MSPMESSGRIWRSLGAVFAGIVVGIALSLGTDALLRAIGVFPPLGQTLGNGLLALATVYRTVFGFVSAYVTARLAPYKPMGHVLAIGMMGLVANGLGAIVTWNQNLGPHWYPILLTVLALPTAWAGGKLWLARR
jgi:Na+/citrate or Na+/malate symporter